MAFHAPADSNSNLLNLQKVLAIDPHLANNGNKNDFHLCDESQSGGKADFGSAHMNENQPEDNKVRK